MIFSKKLAHSILAPGQRLDALRQIFNVLSDVECRQLNLLRRTIFEGGVIYRPNFFLAAFAGLSFVESAFGFIAQDVNEIFPEFVATYTDRKTGEERLALNYDNFGVIAIKAIQEQQMQINEQKKEIEELKKMVLKLTSAAGGENIFSGTVPINSAIDVMLEQNQPNPFNQNTIIRYKIPANAKYPREARR